MSIHTAVPRICFHCGLEGHETSSCTAVDEQSQSGIDAFHCYLEERETKRLQYIHKKPKKKKTSMFYFVKLQEWMQIHCPNLCDPVTASQAAIKSSDSIDFELAKAAHLAHREMFMDNIARIRHRFSVFGLVTKGEHDRIWQHALNDAVKQGSPADFGQVEANRVYADNKLVYRTRYLYYLLLDHNPMSARVRGLLLPSENAAGVRVASFGGGPGYDHLAVSLVALFLSRIQNFRGGNLMPRIVTTQVFDLYAQDWLPSMIDLQDAFHQEALFSPCPLPKIGSEIVDDWWGKNRMTMHFGDLRRQILCGGKSVDPNLENADMLSAVEDTDIFVCQFVLHENASFLVDPDTNLMTGMISYVLRHAKTGAFLICTDSGNTLWPVLQATAEQFGWDGLNGFENDHSIMFGPKSYIVMQRV